MGRGWGEAWQNTKVTVNEGRRIQQNMPKKVIFSPKTKKLVSVARAVDGTMIMHASDNDMNFDVAVKEAVTAEITHQITLDVCGCNSSSQRFI